MNNKEKIADLQNEKDELIDKYRYWKRKCAELKQQLAKKKIQYMEAMDNALNDFIKLNFEHKELILQLAELNKALELACERVKYFEEMQDKEMGHYELFGYENKYDLKSIIKYYINKAKEIKND